MIRWLPILLLLISWTTTSAQSDSTNAAPARNFGLTATGGYTLLRLKSRAFFDPRNGEKGSVQVQNAPALGGGIFYLFAQEQISAGVEAILSQAALVFDTPAATDAKGRVYNLALEVPIHYRYYGFRPMQTRALYLAAGPRFVFNPLSTDTSNPSFSSAYIAADLALGMKQPTKKAHLCLELYFSVGITSLKSGATEWRDETIQQLFRDVVGIRCMFN